jgi:hypothetical protein
MCIQTASGAALETEVFFQTDSVKIELVGLAGAAFMLVGGEGIVLGLLIIAVAILILIKAKPTTALVLRTSSGDQQAYSSHDPELINKIKIAVEDAIVSRT